LYPNKKANTKVLVEFMLHCDPKFEVNAYSKRTEESRVRALKSIQWLHASICLQLQMQYVWAKQVSYWNCCFNSMKYSSQIIVSELEEEEVEQSFRKLPYPLYKYSYEPDDRTRFTFEHVPIANVVGPCFSIPAIARSCQSQLY